jgi:hypothetical protein
MGIFTGYTTDKQGNQVPIPLTLAMLETGRSAISLFGGGAKFFATDITKALDFALAGLPSELAASARNALYKAIPDDPAEAAKVLEKLTKGQRIGNFVVSQIEKYGLRAGAEALSKWAGPIGFAYDVNMMYLEWSATQYGKARQALATGIGNNSMGGSVSHWQSQVIEHTPVDPYDAQGTHALNRFYKERFLSGSSGAFAGTAMTEWRQYVQRNDPTAWQLWKATDGRVADAQTEFDLGQRLNRLAWAFLQLKKDQLRTAAGG